MTKKPITNLITLSTACHRDDHKKCTSHKKGGDHQCKCGCHH